MLTFDEKPGRGKIKANGTSCSLAMVSRLCFPMPHLVQLASSVKGAAGSCAGAAPYCPGWGTAL